MSGFYRTGDPENDSARRAARNAAVFFHHFIFDGPGGPHWGCFSTPVIGVVMLRESPAELGGRSARL